MNGHGPLLAFILVCIVGAFALYQNNSHNADVLYKSQLANCQRINDIRNESNRRIEAHAADRDVLKNFLQTARSARLSAGTHEDRVTADQYLHLANILDKKVFFKPLQTVNCEQVIKHP